MSIWTDRAVRRENGEEKPLGPRAERTRNSILNAAAKVFAERGYQRTTMADVAEAAGVGLGSVYQYFRDRADLVTALVRLSVGRLHVAESDRWRAEAGVVGIEPIVSAYVREYARYRGMAKVWEEVAFVDDDLLELRRAMGRAFTEPVRTALRLAVEHGTVAPDIDVDIAATALTGMIDRWCFVTYVLDPPAREPDPDHAARQLALLWTRAVSATSTTAAEAAPDPRSRPSSASTRSRRRPRSGPAAGR